jgi:hypothetical protein
MVIPGGYPSNKIPTGYHNKTNQNNNSLLKKAWPNALSSAGFTSFEKSISKILLAP